MNAPLTVDQILSAAEAKGFRVDRRTGYMQCPAHRGNDLNCHVFVGKDGGAIAYCHSHDCNFPEIKAALDLGTPKARAQTRPDHAARAETTKPQVVATYNYTDLTGGLRYQTVRKEPGPGGKQKTFFQRRPNGKGGYIDNLTGVDSLPYRLPELLASSGPVLVVEGEKDVDNLHALGFTATCNHGGAGKFSEMLAPYLSGRDVVILPDHDEPGRQHADKVARVLYGNATSMRILELPGLPEDGGDVSDWLAQGGTADELQALIDQAPLWAPPAADDGAALLDEVDALLSRFAVFPSDAARHAVVLWIGHAHLMPVWDVTPRLTLLSAEKRSGKTRVLELIALLVPNPIHTNNASVAALQRLAANSEGLPTLLVDEADAIFGTKTASLHEDLRSFLNAGWGRGVDAIRCESAGRNFQVVQYSSFCPVVLAGIGELPDTIMDRAVPIQMRRRAPGERVERYRRRLEQPRGHALRDRLAVWAQSIEGGIGHPWPEMPVELEDRAADAWEPLIAVAVAAGGEWPARARRAALELLDVNDEEQTENVRLLGDIRAVFGDADALSSEALIQRLSVLAESPWGEINYGKPLTPRGLAQRLKPFGVKPQTIRVGVATPRGYRREDFADAWSRYLASFETSATSATPSENPNNHREFVVALSEAHSATEVQHAHDLRSGPGRVAQQRTRCATENSSNGADVAHVANVADLPSNGEAMFAQCYHRMSGGESTDEEQDILVCWERLVAGEPGDDRYTR